MYYTVYKITNNINGKIYIGQHKTCNLDDGYMGSGKILIQAIAKNGIDNFSKEYLFIYDNEADMNSKEEELVSESFILEDSNYNIKVGGVGGFKPDDIRRGIIAAAEYWRGRTHTEETKAKMRKPKNIGKENPQYGMIWIYSLEEKISKRINKNEVIPEGWYKGRKMKF